ncbi:hypothetical protein BV25DRAFT_1888954 [Artomyces pyxidatus]|uniref:Uncharacterized protein n=1 Tax=Artomyces pyxidatus TaxID=48021 RepID=A0ACB8SVA8_9AGAM|nr:hypothetical protein BV25DRAFT_1888954 [Artomyces pyxidatus]
MSLLELSRIPLLFLAIASYLLATNRPQSAPSQEEQARSTGGKRRSLVDRAMFVLLPTGRTLATYTLLSEAVVSYARATPSTQWSNRILTFLCPEQGSATPIYITPVFVAGIALTIIGGAIRVACLRELGDLFTYELSIRDKHRLITTGPYAIVRHPSYTGIALIQVGVTICELTAGSWWTEAKVISTVVGKVTAVIWTGGSMYVFLTMLRAKKEDAMLREVFGAEWEEYARRVPRRYIPGLV